MTEKADGRVFTIKETLAGAIDQIDQTYQSLFPFKGISTGFQSIDHKTGGLQKGDLIYLTSRDACLRQSFALSMSLNIASLHRAVAYFTSDTLPATIGTQIISSLGRIPFADLKSAQLDERKWNNLITSTEEAIDLELSLIHFTDLSIAHLRQHLLALKESKEAKLAIIDNVRNLSEYPIVPRDNLLKEMKTLAIELDLAIIICEGEMTSSRRRSSNEAKMIPLPYTKVINKHAEHVDTILILHHEGAQADEDKVITVKIRNRDNKLKLNDVRLLYRSDICRLDNAPSLG